jgi:hypothetical protein
MTLDQAFMWNTGTCRPVAKVEIQIGGPYEDENTDAGHRGGATHSRDEGLALDRGHCQLGSLMNRVPVKSQPNRLT